MGDYNQLVLWLGTIVGEENIDEFEKWFKEELGFRVSYYMEFELLNENRNNCVLFYVHKDDLPKFTMFRITTNDMKWFGDYVDNYPSEISDEIWEIYDEYIG